MEITVDQVVRIARLARVRIEEAEIPVLGQELSGILHWIDRLEKVDIESAANFTDCLHSFLPERKDHVTDGNCVEAILANAPEKAHDMFSVPKVVE